MSTEFILVISIVSILIWIIVSKEIVKSVEKINKFKMFTLLSVGIATTLIITISLIQNLIV